MEKTIKYNLKFSLLAIIFLIGFSLIGSLKTEAATTIPRACSVSISSPENYVTVDPNQSLTITYQITCSSGRWLRSQVYFNNYLDSYRKFYSGSSSSWIWQSAVTKSYSITYPSAGLIQAKSIENPAHYYVAVDEWRLDCDAQSCGSCVPTYSYACGLYDGYEDMRWIRFEEPARYTCNSSYQCVVASNGEYTSSNTCQNNCIAPTRYSCNTSTYQCYQTTYGTYATYNDCATVCQPPLNCSITNLSANPTYVNSGGFTYLSWNTNGYCNSCTASANPYNASWTGIENTAGGTQPITNLIQTTTFTLNCSGSANTDTRNVTVTVQTPPPVRYSCNTSTWTCYQNAYGTYASYNDCVTACQPPLTRYTCNANYQCVVASNGEYSSLTSCQNNCVPPVRYNCNTSTYQCYQATNGTYATYNDCFTACQPSQICTPYQTTSCYTSENCNGTKTCNAYGTAWGSCIDIPNDNCPIIQTCPPNQTTSCYTSENCPGTKTCNAYGTAWGSCIDIPNDNCPVIQTCIPYQTTPCTTSEGCTGTKTCNAYGTAWGSCIDNNPNDNCPITTQPLSVSCYASPNPSQVNQTVTFYSNVSGGSGSYTYSWSNYASGNNSYYQTTFGYAGTYTAYLTVSDSYSRSGSTTCSATVYGQSANIPTLSFWADKYTLNQGEATYLRWTSNNANYCVASNGWSGNKSLSNYESTAPNSQITYTLTCYGNGGQVTQSLTLYVTSPTTTLSFTKLGRNLSNGDKVYSKVIRVAQGDIIEFYLTVTAGSANDLSNVVITDNLPSVFSYQSGTTKVNNITQADGITTTGLSLGTIPRNTSKTVTFQALSNNPGTYFTYTNTAQVTASGISTISDNATITFSSVLGAATVATGAEDSLLISVILSIGLAFLVWYYIKFNPQGKLVLAKVENKIRDLRLEYLRRQMIKR